MNNRCHVLIVDDSPVARVTAKKLFKQAGIPLDQIESFKDGSEVVAHFKNKQKNENIKYIIYMDSEMPGMNGTEAIQQIRAHEKESGSTPSFIFTCSATEQEPLLGSNARIDKALTQPNINQMIEKADEHFANSELTQGISGLKM